MRPNLQKKHGVEWFTLEPRSIDLMGAVTPWLAEKQAGGIESHDLEKIEWPEGQSPYPGAGMVR